MTGGTASEWSKKQTGIMTRIFSFKQLQSNVVVDQLTARIGDHIY